MASSTKVTLFASLLSILACHSVAQPAVNSGALAPDDANLASSKQAKEKDQKQTSAFLPAQSMQAFNVEIINDGAPVFRGPHKGALRLGTLARTTVVKAYQEVSGNGCSKKRWFQIGAKEFVCAGDAKRSMATPRALSHPVNPQNDLLPQEYAFVATDGAPVYENPNDYFLNQISGSLGKGYSVVIRERRYVEGVSFARTKRGYWIESQNIRTPRPSEFRGKIIDNGKLDFMWTIRKSVPLFTKPNGKKAGVVEKHTLLTVRSQTRGWIESESGYIRRKDVTLPTTSALPADIKSDELWIDISVATQVLIVYRGNKPIFATLISSGKARKTHATPLGEHRIWIKLAYSDMDNLENTSLESNYALREVPWVQYFKESNGLHAAFWHNDFGRRKSHGCINLAPLDASTIFEMTAPILPPGWKAIFAREHNPGTMIRVRP